MSDQLPQGESEEVFTEAPFCLIDPDNGPSPIIRRTAKHDIFRIIADRLEQQRDSEAPKALNDPSVECCGRDAADCDCPAESD